MILIYPTINHESYINYMRTLCDENQLSLILKGSLAIGKGKMFSDIDLLLCGDLNNILLDKIISKYDFIVMTNYTENPKGIFILNYRNGISVDLDIRDTVLQTEINNNLVLCDFGFKVTDTIIRKQIKSTFLPERPEWYKTIRLIHRCCIKCLCGKTEDADKLSIEVMESVNKCCKVDVIYENNLVGNNMQFAFETICHNYKVEQEVIILFSKLFKYINNTQ